MNDALNPEQKLTALNVRPERRRVPASDRDFVTGRLMSPARPAPSPLKPALVPNEKPRVEPKTFETFTPDQCVAQPPRGYVVKGLIAPGDVALIVGHPGCGKSLLAPYIGYCVAQGEPMFGRWVKKAPVLYIAAEAPGTMPPRIAALRKDYDDAPDFHLVCASIDLYGDAAEDCISTIIATARKIGAGMVFIDTLAAAFPGLKENDSEEMGRAVSTFRRIARETGAAVVVTHHIPKAGDTPRGHGALNGDADVVMQISGTESSARVVNLSKNRSGPSGDAGMSFRVEGVALGTDDDKDPITAPMAVEEDAETIGNIRKHSLSGQPKAALGHLNDLLAEAGNKLPLGPMFPPHPELRCVPFEEWRTRCAARSLTASAGKRAANLAFQRSAEKLMEGRFIATGEHQGVKLVWVAEGAGT